MKYILVNPENLVSEINKNGRFGNDCFMTRINFGQSEPEWDFADKFIEAARNKIEKGAAEADITSVFEYHNYGVTPRIAIDQLKKLVEIESFYSNEYGEEIVYISYMSAKEMCEKTAEERAEANRRWCELEEKLKSLAPKQYSPEEIAQIVRYVLERYTQDLLQRDDIVFEQKSRECIIKNRESRIGDRINIGGGKQYYPEPKVYSVNGENIIVSACIKGSDDLVVAPDYRMTNDGAMFVDILRKGQDGQYEDLARCIKDIDKSYGVSVSCHMGDLYYSVKTKKENNSTQYYISTKMESNYSSEDGFKEFSKDMVGTASIDRLYDAYVRKIRFQFPDKSRTVQKPPMEWGIREVGDWPDKRPTILSFEDIMSFRETPSIQDIASNELPDNAPKKRQ